MSDLDDCTFPSVLCHLVFLKLKYLLQHPARGPRWLSRYSDSLRAGRSRDRNSIRVRISAPVQTGPGPQIASCTKGTGSFLVVKRPGRGADYPPHLVPSLRKRIATPSLHFWAFTACSKVKCTFTFTSTQPSNILRVFCPDVRDVGMTKVLIQLPVCQFCSLCARCQCNAGLSPRQQFTRARNSDRLPDCR